MSKDNSDSQSSVTALKSAAAELLQLLVTPDITESDLFPFGVNHVAITVRQGDAEISLEVSGPQNPHVHDHDDEDEWMLDPVDLDDDL
ncbi:MAG: hypothetical protein ACO1SX_23050 [Actinomycetota bacterium]